MITITKYHNDSFDTLKELHARNSSPTLPHLSPETLPNIGFIAQDDNITVAMGFLRLVEGGYAQIDTLVSNPEASSNIRHDGISKVVDSLMESAKELKLKGIMAVTNDKSVISRGLSSGFKGLPAYLLVRTL